MADLCPCGSGEAYEACCGPVIRGERAARTAEELMRSRYSAYVKHEIDHLHGSLHPGERKDWDPKGTRDWAERAEWHGLEIHATEGGGPDDEEGTVEFTATFTDAGQRLEHRELATFRREGGAWYFVDGRTPPGKTYVREAPKVGRNDPCPCGSGKKHKKCCGS